MASSVVLPRRLFLVRATQGTLALAVVALTGCAPAASSSRGASAVIEPTDSPSSAPTDAAPPSTAASPSSDPTTGGEGITWERVDLGFVSAYVLVRGGEAAIVDTGVTGSEGDIETALGRVGLGWDAVGHVILTHLHGDHAGSAEAVLSAAADATGYAGAEDLAGIASPRPLQAVADGDAVFDLRIVTTPGHTPGSISVFDEAGGIMVVGDALTTDGTTVAGPNPGFTDDMDTAMASVAKLAGFAFDTLLVGHGPPITTGASALVAALAEG